MQIDINNKRRLKGDSMNILLLIMFVYMIYVFYKSDKDNKNKNLDELMKRCESYRKNSNRK